MNNRRFWEADFVPRNAPATVESQANRLLEAVTSGHRLSGSVETGGGGAIRTWWMPISSEPAVWS